MRDLMTLLPIFAFMMIPIWIPVVAMVFGALHDAVLAPAKMARRAQKAPVAAPKHAAAPHVAPHAAPVAA